MAIKPKITKSKPHTSVVSRSVKKPKPKPVGLRSLGDLNESEKAGVASALNAAANLASKEKNESLNDFLPDDIESLQSESKKKIRNRVATAMKLLNFIEGRFEGRFEDTDNEDTTPVTLSQFLANRRNRNDIRRSLAALKQDNFNYFCSNCRIRCRSCGRRKPSKV